MSDNTKAADKKAPPPDPKPEPVEVEFASDAPQKRVYNKGGGLAVRFSDGKVTTSDEGLIALLDDTPGVRRTDD